MYLESKSREELINAIAGNSTDIQGKERIMGTSKIPGQVLFPDMKGFGSARTSVWNYDAAGMPALIVKCANAKDISSAITFAVQHSLKFAFILPEPIQATPLWTTAWLLIFLCSEMFL